MGSDDFRTDDEISYIKHSDSIWARVTPQLEAKDREIRKLRSQVLELETKLEKFQTSINKLRAKNRAERRLHQPA